jgi:hypothetical protein
MKQKTDLYSLLVSYGEKNNPVLVEEAAFFSFLESHSISVGKGFSEDNFRTEIERMSAEGKCELVYDKTGKCGIYLPLVCRGKIDADYEESQENKSRPFPSEEILGIKIPESRLLEIMNTTELAAFMEDSMDEGGGKEGNGEDARADGDGQKSRIVKINFPEGFGSALVLPDMIPRKLIETAFTKIQSYMQDSTNKEYLYIKLEPQFRKKENYLRRMMDTIQQHPWECCVNLTSGDELANAFWASFCGTIKTDIEERNSRMSNLLGVIQGAFVIEAANHWCMVITAKKKKKRQALQSLEDRLQKPPYLFNMEDITKFTDSGGTPLLDLYTKEELRAWLNKKVSESVDGRMPEFLLFQTPDRGQVFIHKSQLLPVCVRHISETSGKLKDMISKRWTKILRDYRREPAMDEDKAFEAMLRRNLGKADPFLLHLLNDSRLLFVYDEMDWGREETLRIFSKGALNTYSALFNIRRKPLLDEIKISLPLRYTLPIISSIIAFFKHLARGQTVQDDDDETGTEARTGGREPAIKKLEAAIVPPGSTLDTYLEELKDRWMQLTDKQSREDILRDVNTLIKNKFAQTMSLRKGRAPSFEELTEMAENLIEWTPSLKGLRGREALKKYIETRFLKLLSAPQRG